MTGSGKTTLEWWYIRDLVEKTQPGSRRTFLIFDPKREWFPLLSSIHLPIPIYLLDGTDARGYAWAMAKDLVDANTAKTAAGAMSPDVPGNPHPYFREVAALIIESLLRTLIRSSRNWTLLDVLLILDNVPLLKQLLPPSFVATHLADEAATTTANTLSTLHVLVSRYETVAASWAHAEKEGRTLSLTQFADIASTGICVIPQRPDIARATKPLVELQLQHISSRWLARPEVNCYPPNQQWRTYAVFDEVQEAGKFIPLPSLCLQSRSKAVTLVVTAIDVEPIRAVFGEKEANGLLNSMGNVAGLRMQSPATQRYLSERFGRYEIERRLQRDKPKDMRSAIAIPIEQLFKRGEVRIEENILPSQFAEIPDPKHSGEIAGYFLTGSLVPHFASFPFRQQLTRPTTPGLVERPPEHQEMPDSLTPEDLKRLGLPTELFDTCQNCDHSLRSLPMFRTRTYPDNWLSS